MRAVHFAYQRCTRIFPLYWIVLACAVVVSHWIPTGVDNPGISKQFSVDHIFLNTLGNWFVPPAWTLDLEVHFYAIATLFLLIAPRQIFLSVACMMFGWLALNLLDLRRLTLLTHPLVLEFGFGAVIAYLASKRVSSFPIVAAGVSVILFISGVVIVARAPIGEYERLCTYGLGAALIIYAVVAAELRGLRFPKFGQYLGEASYSIYVWHYLLLTIFAAFTATTPYIPGPVVIVIWIVLIMAISLLSYEYLERPLLHFTRHPDRLIYALGLNSAKAFGLNTRASGAPAAGAALQATAEPPAG